MHLCESRAKVSTSLWSTMLGILSRPGTLYGRVLSIALCSRLKEGGEKGSGGGRGPSYSGIGRRLLGRGGKKVQANSALFSTSELYSQVVPPSPVFSSIVGMRALL